MLKQFNLELLAFRDPTIQEEGWFDIETQDEINSISASITGGGEVWEENGKIKYSGKSPSEYHVFNMRSKQFEISPEKLTALLIQRKTALLNTIADKTDSFKAQYLQGYSQAEIESFYRQEREARNELPLMLLTEIFEGRDDLKSVEDLKKKVIEKADLFAIIMGKLFAIKQGFETHLEKAQTMEELDNIEQEINKWQKL
ncbi:MAG: phage tail protein [Haemophilus parainfluenzae]|nr:phage tail protein [Haemophilus parainfluenzae]